MRWSDKYWDEKMLQYNRSKIYVSGKMRGLPDHGFALFNDASARLRAEGFEVFNPAENPEQPSWEEYMKYDLANLVKCDFVYVLDNWRDSRGARIEVRLARELKIPVISYTTRQPVEFETVLEEADRLVNGARQEAYGHPHDDYTCATGMFNPYLRKKYGQNLERFNGLDAADGVVFMLCVKISREANMHKRDNMVDLAGYAQCLFMVKQREAELERQQEEATKPECCQEKKISHTPNMQALQRDADQSLEQYINDLRKKHGWTGTY